MLGLVFGRVCVPCPEGFPTLLGFVPGGSKQGILLFASVVTWAAMSGPCLPWGPPQTGSTQGLGYPHPVRGAVRS